jgi:hypothetical protein
MEIRHLTDDEVQEYLDGNLPQKDGFIQDHLKTCQFCQEAVVEYKSLYLELKDDKGFKLSRNFAQWVISRIPKQPAAKSHFSYVEALLVVLGIVAAGLTSIYLVDLRPLAQRITAIGLPQLDLLLALVDLTKRFLIGLHINSNLLLFSGLTLLIIRGLDGLVSATRQKPITSFK